MRKLILAAGLSCALFSGEARADEVKDLDAWAKDMTAALGRTDMDAMVGFIRPHVPAGPDMAKVEDAARKVSERYGRSKVLYAEQFEGAKVGDFARRVDVAVVYDAGQEFYTFLFIRGVAGWRFYSYKMTGELAEVMNVPW